MARNSIKFEEAKPEVNGIAHNCLINIQKLSKYRKFPDILTYPALCAPKFPKFSLVCWQPPHLEWVKVNTNGSYLASHAGMGGIFRDSYGACLLFFHSPVMDEDPLEAEAQDIFWAISLARKLGIRNLWLESDSLILINILNRLLSSPWNLVY
ncbi:uncharacterized protein LOC110038913 [Phalaenopsis equestris]|uniref:uncharacterized protein LOC110038913 n=1 Tax=Phalaenopsis equestris TaxID=78828 RepID=UPI0009E3CA8E|nr:uncharacterized protein LOC110038913 [Phalaenopsis equestris]